MYGFQRPEMRHRKVAKNLFQKREHIDTKDSIGFAGYASHIRTIGTLQKVSSPRVLHATSKARSASIDPPRFEVTREAPKTATHNG